MRLPGARVVLTWSLGCLWCMCVTSFAGLRVCVQGATLNILLVISLILYVLVSCTALCVCMVPGAYKMPNQREHEMTSCEIKQRRRCRSFQLTGCLRSK